MFKLTSSSPPALVKGDSVLRSMPPDGAAASKGSVAGVGKGNHAGVIISSNVPTHDLNAYKYACVLSKIVEIYIYLVKYVLNINIFI